QIDHRPDLVVLDLGLPDLDGGEMLRMLRGVSDVPVIVATARDDEDEIVRVLGVGADDYVVKPFTAKQLDARIQAVLRRSGAVPQVEETVEVGPLRIDPRGRSALLDGRVLELSPKEFDLLHYLAARAGEAVAKRQLLTDVWYLPFVAADKTDHVHLPRLPLTVPEPRQ